MTWLIARAKEEGCSFEEIGDMTEAQLYGVVLHPRDDKGNLERPPKVDSGADPLAGLRMLALSRGVPRHRLEAEVRAMMGAI